jgi:uncharacterized protein (DUF1684 family)
VERLTYEQEILRWREQMEASLRAEDGWLTLIGLFWLEEGQNYFGSDSDNQIVLPSGKVPAHAGSFEHRAGATTLRVAAGAPVRLNGQQATLTVVRPDSSGQPDLVTIGDIAMLVIQRGDRFAIRARDRRSPARESFGGRRWFPIDESYRVAATFVPHESATTIPILNVLGTTEQRHSPGALVFQLGGQLHRLDALVEGDELFIIFRDQTSGEATYPAGRFLKAAMPKDGRVTLDFNRAYSPPCAFTEFATCPLPPPQNRLPIRVEAGELYEHN